MYCLPQEIEVWYIIPALRKELAKELVKKGLSMQAAGEILGISKAAVSQYLSNKRANKIKLDSKIQKEIQKSAGLIIQDKSQAVQEIQRLMKIVKTGKQYCQICKKLNIGITKFCKCGCNTCN